MILFYIMPPSVLPALELSTSFSVTAHPRDGDALETHPPKRHPLGKADRLTIDHRCTASTK